VSALGVIDRRDGRVPVADGFSWTDHPRKSLVGLSVLLLALFGLIRSVSTRVLGLNLTGDGVLDRGALQGPGEALAGDPARPDGRRWLLLRPTARALERHHRELASQGKYPVIVDLRDPITLPLSGADPKRALELRHVEIRLLDPEWRRQLLGIIQSASVADLILVSEIDPFHYLAQRLREANAAYLRAASNAPANDLAEMKKALAAQEVELSAWAIVLRYGVPASAAKRKADELLHRIELECASSDVLARVQASLAAHPETIEHGWIDVVQFVLDAAEPYYRSLWDLCSEEEKLVLIQLAETGFVNPKKVELVRRLARRRLVKLDPSFRLINESFREFVLTAESPDRVTAWEHAHPAESWSRIGVPLYALAATLVGLLVVTQETLLVQLAAVATASAGSLAAIRNLVVSVRNLTGEKIA
jgi:hypothetical protein